MGKQAQPAGQDCATAAAENFATVAIVAASGYAADPLAVGRATERLEKLGCRVRNFYDADAKYLRFGGTDEARIAQLHQAAADPEVDIVLALRGGYGMSRLLPRLDLGALSASGKLFVGHSDFTALQMALLAHDGTISYAGPMICDDFSREDPSDYTLDNFWRCVSGASHSVALAPAEQPAVDVSGILWGGNLTMLTHLVGTPYLPHISGGILFIEDVNEHPYRVERMLLQLAHAGLLDQKAIVLGDFSAYRLYEYDNGYDFDAMLSYLRQTLPLPILTGLPFGHIRDKATLAIGSHARLHSDGRHAMLTMSGYPALHARAA
ncbi:muramoyltetrapeptide carboxypeptidase [Noviherbaspirillum sp. CPCC 100848]|uniref:Muramoyltetrapeptide carboxypeptidase n=1 Tax=Noviherbaspirillum album TaxID=3080276 RepID=A0ABU6J6Z8_9BURK|nr:muramoyltetrapeptide carboxypeptidase [Noviherbaspirillum sp. CPCC 100848]MEC4719408.1 muramoyltetrapeptide carboxypeptidase [Noviherbaspirillum sp. CPCC 100848]